MNSVRRRCHIQNWIVSTMRNRNFLSIAILLVLLSMPMAPAVDSLPQEVATNPNETPPRQNDASLVRLDPQLSLPPVDLQQPHVSALVAVEAALRQQERDPKWVHTLLAPDATRSSASGLHVFFRGQVNGVPILGARAAVHYLDGAPWAAQVELPTSPPPAWKTAPPPASSFLRQVGLEVAKEQTHSALVSPEDFTGALEQEPEPVWVWRNEQYHEAYRVTVNPHPPEGGSSPGWRVLLHPSAPHLDQAQPNWLGWEGIGRVFPVSPQVAARNPDLRDDLHGNETPELAALTTQVVLPRLDGPNPLGRVHLEGQFVDVDTDTNETDAQFLYPRSDPRFEDTMTYYYMDYAQAELQRLGFLDANNESQWVQAPEEGVYNAYFYIEENGRDYIVFGYHAPTPNGLADAAEDADVILHEYGHAVMCDIASCSMLDLYFNDVLAIAEGFADAFALLMLLPLNDGYDPTCMGDWFSSYRDPNREDGDAFCFRRTDTSLTFPDVLDAEGHYGGQVISGLLWGLAEVLGRDTALSLMVEANYYLPTSIWDMRDYVEPLLLADEGLYGGEHQEIIAAIAHGKRLTTPHVAQLLGIPYEDPVPPHIYRVSQANFLVGEEAWVDGRGFVDRQTPGAPLVRIGNWTIPGVEYQPNGVGLSFNVPDIPLGAHNLTIVRADGLVIQSPWPLVVTDPLVVNWTGERTVELGQEIEVRGSGFGPVPWEPNRSLQVISTCGGDYPSRVKENGTVAIVRIPDFLNCSFWDPATLRIERSDGRWWQQEEALRGLPPELALEVESAPLESSQIDSPHDTEGSPEWTLRVTNEGPGRFPLNVEKPVQVRVFVRQESFPSHTFEARFNATISLEVGASVRFEVDMDDSESHVGTWSGEARIETRDIVLNRNTANDSVELYYRFLPIPGGT